MDILKLEERMKLLKGDKQKCKMRIVNICLSILKRPEISVYFFFVLTNLKP